MCRNSEFVDILNHSDPVWVKRECQVWHEILSQLRGDLTAEKPEFRSTMDDAIESLNECISGVNGPTEDTLSKTRVFLVSFLGAFRMYDSVFRAAFALKFSLRGLDDVVSEAEELNADELDCDEKQNLKSQLMATLGAIEGLVADIEHGTLKKRRSRERKERERDSQ